MAVSQRSVFVMCAEVCTYGACFMCIIIITYIQDKIEKEELQIKLEHSDAGQLLIYLLAHALENICKGHNINEVGLYTEGFKVRI